MRVLQTQTRVRNFLVLVSHAFFGTHISGLHCTGDDVEESPGPTMFDIIDPTTTVSADSSQGNEATFGVNARSKV